MIAKSLSLAFLFSLLFKIALSQPPTLTLYSLTESNGLSDNRITAVFQDHQGFMWIGTEDGLNRYDGSVFKIFKGTSKDSADLADNHIYAIAEDANHHLWIATMNGLSEFDPRGNSFHTWRPSSSMTSINMMLDIQIDKDDNIWIGTMGGLLRFIPSQNKFFQYDIISDNPLDNRIKRILIDKKNRFWIATYNGLWRFYPDTKKFERVNFGKDKFESLGLIIAMTEGSDGKVWMGYWDKGLKYFDPETGTGKSALRGESLNVEGVTEVANMQGGHDIWFGNLMKINGEEEVTNYTIRTNPPNSNYHVTKLYRSNDGLLWLCSDKGVMIMNPMKQFFHHHYFPQELTHQGFAFQTKKNNLYVGGAGLNFLKLYDSAFHFLKSYSLTKDFEFPTAALLSIVREDDDHIWLCTENGVLLMDERNGTQQFFRLTEKECKVSTRNFFNTMFIDSRKNHWIFPWRGGIWQLDPQNKIFIKKLDGLTIENGQPKGLLVAAAAEDGMGNIWFADLDEGLIKFDREKNKFSKPTEKYIHSRYNLSNIYYSRPYIWGVTTGVVFRIHERTQAYEHWSIPPELNKTVTGFCTDEQNRFWVSTRNGLLSFDMNSKQFNHFTTNDGLVDDLMVGSIFQSNGNIFYGDHNFITVFKSRELVKSSSGSPILITEVLSQMKPLQIQNNSDHGKYIQLDYTYNNFTFSWAVLNYSNPLQNRYYCKLEGVEKDWRYVGNTGSIQYASLSPGRYFFRASGATSDGVMNEVGDAVTIVIHPPFWKTWLFYFSCGLGFLGLSYGVYRYRLNQILKTQKLRNKISSDLHDEIGSTLSSISIMSDLLLQKTREEKTSEVANEIRGNAIVLMEKMDDIVWSINPKNDSLENLLLRVKRFAAQLFEAKNIDYEINIDHSVKQVNLTMEFRQNIYLILKEAVNNLVKHAHCKKASIEVTQSHGLLHLKIIDDGLGFDSTIVQLGNGLASMKDRASLMNMKLNILSKQGEGTSVWLSVKIK